MVFHFLLKINCVNIQVRVAFVELYKETLYDLLSPKDKKEDCAVDLREDPRSGVTITNLTEVGFTADKRLYFPVLKFVYQVILMVLIF